MVHPGSTSSEADTDAFTQDRLLLRGFFSAVCGDVTLTTHQVQTERTEEASTSAGGPVAADARQAGVGSAKVTLHSRVQRIVSHTSV